MSLEPLRRYTRAVSTIRTCYQLKPLHTDCSFAYSLHQRQAFRLTSASCYVCFDSSIYLRIAGVNGPLEIEMKNTKGNSEDPSWYLHDYREGKCVALADKHARDFYLRLRASCQVDSTISNDMC